MNEKILTADLVNAVAELTAIPKNRCDDFVKAFFDAIANALAIDGIVKVKGLGTFKLISVEERKSVNVQTGAEMIIPAHAKVSFTPDKVLKDEINKPYAHLKTYVLNPNAPLDPPENEDDDVMEEGEGEPAADSVVAPAEAPTQQEELPEVTVTSEPETEKPAEVADEVVTDNTETVQEEKTQSSHSDWFDNWEVEYEGEGVAEPAALMSDKVAETVTPAQQEVVVTEEVTASIEEDSAQKSAEASTEEKAVVAEEATTEINAAVAEAETGTEVNNVVAEEVETAEPEQTEQSEQEGAAVAEAEVAEKIEPVVDAVTDSNGNQPVDVAETATETVDKQSDEPTTAATQVADETVEQGGNDEVVASEETKTEVAEEEPKTTPNEIDDVPPSITTVIENEGEPEKVQHGKVLGVAIITFLVLLVAAYFGLKHIDPDFFKTLKVSDNPPVMPADTTTSLAQELSVYVPEKDTVVDADQQLAVDTADSVVPASEQMVVEESAATVANDVIDPLWNGEFVAYMKRQHKDVSLATSGLIGETAIKPGLFLTMVALQNYGDKAYWIYLYLYNTDRIKNPNNVPVGTKIRVPNLDKSLVNGPAEEQVNLAKEIRQKFVK